MERPPITLRDTVFFFAVSNVHYPLLVLAGAQFSIGLLPVSLALLAGWAFLAGRLRVTAYGLAFATSSVAYFSFLSVAGISYSAFGAYVVVMQTTTAVIFLDYLLSLSPGNARRLILNQQRLLGRYVAAYTMLVIYIRLYSDVDTFNQVAQSNYLGLLTTYLALSVLDRGRIGSREAMQIATLFALNVLSEQRSSLLVNGVLLAGRLRAATVTLAAIGAIVLLGSYVFASQRFDAIIDPLVSHAWDYWSLVRLDLWELEDVIRQAVATNERYDASILLRIVSMFYVTSQIFSDPFVPAITSDYEYFSNSHNLILEYLKVGGLFLAVVSAAMLVRRVRALTRNGHFALHRFGLLLAFGYSFLFNDLYLGLLLLPLSLHISEGSERPAAEPDSHQLAATAPLTGHAAAAR